MHCIACGEELKDNYDCEGNRSDECPNAGDLWHEKMHGHIKATLTKFVNDMKCDAITSYPRSKEWTQGVEWVIRRAKLRIEEI